MGPAELPDPLEVAASITRSLEGLGVRYLIGGSLASSVHGEPRSTNDVDLLVDFAPSSAKASSTLRSVTS